MCTRSRAEAMRLGFSVEDIYESSKIDRWFLEQIKGIVDTEAKVQQAINALGCGRFIITHREHSLSEGDEVWRLQAGRLVRAG